jgi:hypothetical protein
MKSQNQSIFPGGYILIDFVISFRLDIYWCGWVDVFAWLRTSVAQASITEAAVKTGFV